MKYTVSLKKTDGGYSVSARDFQAVGHGAKTEGEALENIAEAINDYLTAAAEPVGGEKGEVGQVEVAA